MKSKFNQKFHNTIELKHLNLRCVYDYLYKVRTASRLDISINTGLSLPTVSANIHELEENSLVNNCGEQESTGGRRAQEYSCNSQFKIAVGVEILKESIQIVAVDLYGTILFEDSDDTCFCNDEGYFKALGKFINGFVKALPFEKNKVLGICIAFQGLISDDGNVITYCEILKCTGLKRDRFQKYIELPCVLLHDTEAAALAEIWHEPDIMNAVYISLNRNFGGTLILNGEINKSKELSSATIEHMRLDPDGPLCYCGRKGCLESYCSANHLKEEAGIPIPDFFDLLHNGDDKCRAIWNSYIKYLAIGLNNIRMVVDCGFIIGGYLVQFMNDDDWELLRNNVEQQFFFKGVDFVMKTSKYGDKSPKLGAAIALVDSFLNSIW